MQLLANESRRSETVCLLLSLRACVPLLQTMPRTFPSTPCCPDGCFPYGLDYQVPHSAQECRDTYYCRGTLIYFAPYLIASRQANTEAIQLIGSSPPRASGPGFEVDESVVYPTQRWGTSPSAQQSQSTVGNTSQATSPVNRIVAPIMYTIQTDVAWTPSSSYQASQTW